VTRSTSTGVVFSTTQQGLALLGCAHCWPKPYVMTSLLLNECYVVLRGTLAYHIVGCFVCVCFSSKCVCVSVCVCVCECVCV
jgi:hypothetical protein